MGLSTTYLMTLRGHDQVSSKVVSAVLLGGVGLGRIVVGFITRRGKTHPALVTLFGLTAALSTTYLLTDSGGLVFPLAAALGLTVSGLLPLSIATVGLIYREQASAAMGLVKFAIPMGGVLVPLLFSGLSSVLAFRWAVLVIPVLFAVGFALSLASRGTVLRALAAER
jgi:MFS family permease